MPELPEVETVRRQLAPRLIGRRIVEADSHPSAKFTPAVEAVGARFVEADRRGKFLLFRLDDDRELVIHLGMTGRLGVVEPDALRAGRPGDGRPGDGVAGYGLPGDGGPGDGGPDDADPGGAPHLRAWWRLDDGGRLEFVDIRRFGRIRVVPRGDHSTIPTLHRAGPEPWDPDLDARRFHELLSRSRRRLKTRLLSQQPVAGIGNIYADEALWLAGIDPRTTRISPARAGLLLEAIREVLERGIDNGGTTLRDYRDATGRSGSNQHSLAAYGRAGRPCLRCGDELRGAIVDARATSWCPTCQRR